MVVFDKLKFLRVLVLLCRTILDASRSTVDTSR